MLLDAWGEPITGEGWVVHDDGYATREKPGYPGVIETVRLLGHEERCVWRPVPAGRVRVLARENADWLEAWPRGAA